MKKLYVLIAGLLFFHLAAGIVCAETGDDILKMAVKAGQEELYDLSNEQLEKFLQAGPRPNTDYALLLYASNLIKLKNFPEAEKKLRFLAEKYPQSRYLKDALTYLTLLLLETDDMPAALTAYDALTARFGKDENIEGQMAGKLFTRAVNLFNAGSYAEAQDLFQLLNVKFPRSPRGGETAYYLGLMLYRENKFNEAAGYFDRAVAAVTGNREMSADAYLKLGDCRFNLDEPDKAEECYRKVLADFSGTPAVPWADYQLALILKKNRRYAEAEKHLLAAASGRAEESLTTAALLESGRIKILEEKWSEAEKYMQELVKKYPSSPKTSEALMQLGFISFNTGNTARAVPYFEKYIAGCATEAEKVPGYFGLGYANYKNGSVEKAALYWGKILKAYPDSAYAPEILFLLGKKYFEAGDYGLTVRYMGRLAVGFPENRLAAPAYPALTEAYIRQEKFPEARAACETFLKKNKSEEMSLLYGKTLYLMKDPAAGVPALESFASSNPVLKAEGLYYLGKLLQQAGEDKKARERFLEIITFYPQAKEWSGRARKELKKAE